MKHLFDFLQLRMQRNDKQHNIAEFCFGAQFHTLTSGRLMRPRTLLQAEGDGVPYQCVTTRAFVDNPVRREVSFFGVDDSAIVRCGPSLTRDPCNGVAWW